MPDEKKVLKQKRFFPEHFWRFFKIEAFLFSITQSLGIITAFEINKSLVYFKIEVPQISFWRFIFQFAIASFFIFFIIRFIKNKGKKAFIFKIFFSLAVLTGAIFVLSVWFGDMISLFLVLILLLWWWKKPSILIQNICMVLSMAGVGGVLGLALNPETMIAFLAVFSVYDIIAVYKTKHMVEMAKDMIENKVVLGLVIPSSLSGFNRDLKNIKPGGEYLILGGGDIVFPLLFSCSLVYQGLLPAFIISVFSLMGLFVSSLLFIRQKERKPIPALPPIALFSIIGFLIARYL